MGLELRVKQYAVSSVLKAAFPNANAYFLAKFRFDTAENELAKNLQKIANYFLPILLPMRLPWFEARGVPREARDVVQLARLAFGRRGAWFTALIAVVRSTLI